jgi:hypothetical protein
MPGRAKHACVASRDVSLRLLNLYTLRESASSRWDDVGGLVAKDFAISFDNSRHHFLNARGA